MTLSFIIPTRDRTEQLSETLSRLGSLDGAVVGDSELFVIDNASQQPMSLPSKLPNGISVCGIPLKENVNTAARNIGAELAQGEWLVMLDDDSSPLQACDFGALDRVEADVAVLGGEVLLPSGERESGGLPEVFIGCGCAIRRDAFLRVRGYDASFGYYAEEYDLCARLISDGYRISHTRSLRFEHRKSASGRDMNEIMYRLVRNNGWVLKRYAPIEQCEPLIDATVTRYRVIAEKEGAEQGYRRGLAELRATLDDQPDRALTDEHWSRFEGRTAVRTTIRDRLAGSPVRVVGPEHAKGRSIIESELSSNGCTLSGDHDAKVMIGTLSPGPMLDLLQEFPDAITPWNFLHLGEESRPTEA